MAAYVEDGTISSTISSTLASTNPNDNMFSARLIPRVESPAQPAWLSPAQKGETWALEHFYNDYRQITYALCYRMLGNPDDAEDAVQAAFICAFRGLSRFRGHSSVQTWLYRIAMNECLSLLRKRKRQPLPLDVEVAGTVEGPGSTEDLHVQAALARVRPEYRAVLVLRFWEDLSYDEIAAALGISLPATRMRLKRAKDEFRRYYQG